MSDTKEINSLSSALTAAISTIADSKSSPGTLVKEAVIKEIIDEGLGTYKVQYLENTFEASTVNSEIVYKVGENVYILIPDGDFSKPKIILAPVNNNTTTFASTVEEKVYIPLGDNLFPTIPAQLELSSMRNTPATYVPDLNLRDFNDTLSTTIVDSRTLALKCNIRTSIEPEQRKAGNYGLILTIPAVKGEETIDYKFTLDIHNLKGDLYNYSVWSEQTLYFTIPEDAELDLTQNPTLEYFVESFILQAPEGETAIPDIFIDNIQLISCLEITEDNMTGYKVIVTASGGNSFYGKTLNEKKTLSVTMYLNGKVTNLSNFNCYWFRENACVGYEHKNYNSRGKVGWEILNKKTKTSTDAGGAEGYEYVTNEYTYQINADTFLSDTRYKCVLEKINPSDDDEGKFLFEGLITIHIVNAPVELQIFADHTSNKYVENIGTAKITMRCIDRRDLNMESSSITCVWKRYDKSSEFINNDGAIPNVTAPQIVGKTEKGYTIYESTIDLKVAKINFANRISCSAISVITKEEGNVEQLIGTKSVMLTTTTAADYYIDLENGDKLYKYDADGDSPYVADYDGPLASALNKISPIAFRLFHIDDGGNEFTDEEYKVIKVEWLVPKENTLIELDTNLKKDSESNPGYYTITGNYDTLKSLSYGIANKFVRNNTNNSIILKVYFKNSIVSSTANVRFLKDGESGTNGTKYAAIVTYNGYGYREKDSNGIENKIQLFYVYEDDQWLWYDHNQNELVNLFPNSVITQLGVSLYANGNKLEDAEVEWELTDKNITYNNMYDPIEISPTGQITLKDFRWIDQTFNLYSIIQAKVSAKRDADDTSLTDSEGYVYAYYPIETVYVEKRSYLDILMPTITGGFSQVIYAEDGTNAQFDSSNPFHIENLHKDLDVNSLYDFKWAGSDIVSRVATYEDDNSKCDIIPKSKLDNGVTKNYIRVSVIPKKGIQTHMNVKRQVLEQEKQQIDGDFTYYNALQLAGHGNGIEGDSNERGVYKDFNYKERLETFKNLSDAFLLKTYLYNACQSLFDELWEIQNYGHYTLGMSDNELQSIYEKRLDVSTLHLKCAGLGYFTPHTQTLMADILTNYTPVSLELDRIITSQEHMSINIKINNYNQNVRILYKPYFDQLNNGNSQGRMNDLEKAIVALSNYINNDARWTTLEMTPQNPSKENLATQQIYKKIKETLNNYVKKIKDEVYSFDGFLDQIFEPIHRQISALSTISYKTKVEKLKARQNELANALDIMDDMQVIEQPPQRVGGQTPFGSETPLMPLLSFTPFQKEDLARMTDYAISNLYNYTTINRDNSPFYLAIEKEMETNNKYKIRCVMSTTSAVATVPYVAKKTGLIPMDGENSPNVLLPDDDGYDIDGHKAKTVTYNFPSNIEIKLGDTVLDKNGYSIQAGEEKNLKLSGQDSYIRVYEDSEDSRNDVYVNLPFKNCTFIYIVHPNQNQQYCSAWEDQTATTSDINLKHKGVLYIRDDKNPHVPFYCSKDIYVKDSTNTNYLWLKAGGNMVPDSGSSSSAAVITSGLIYIKPIITIYNVFGHSNINGWDGNKVQVADGYILAPQMGAGKKENGKFTGIIMGVNQLKPNEKSKQKIGLFGFKEGKQSLFLNSRDGSAIFGLPDTCQIIIDPQTKKGLLYSSNYWKDYKFDGKPDGYGEDNENGQGMLIDLSTPEIKYGNGCFVVNHVGHLTAKGGGSIAGWNITDTTLSSPIVMGSNNKPINGEDSQIFLDAGLIEDENHQVVGADQGKIYSGKHNNFSSTKKGFYLSYEGLSICNEDNGSKLAFSTTGTPSIYSNKYDKIYNDNGSYFIPSGTGFHLSQQGLGIKGEEGQFRIGTKGTPLLFSNNHNELTSVSDGFYLGSNGLSIGSTIRIESGNSGRILIGRLRRDGSQDEGKFWTINGYDGNNGYAYIGYNTNHFGCSNLDDPKNYSIDSSLNVKSVYLGTNGIRLGKKFAVDEDGNMVAKQAIIKGTINVLGNGQSKIGSWQVNQSNLYNYSPEDGQGPPYYDICIGADGNLYSRTWDCPPFVGPGDNQHFTVNWSIQPDGKAYFSNLDAKVPSGKALEVAGGLKIDGGNINVGSGTVTINGTDGLLGKVGPFTVSSTSFAGGGINLLYSNGSINCYTCYAQTSLGSPEIYRAGVELDNLYTRTGTTRTGTCIVNVPGIGDCPGSCSVTI